MTHGCINDAVDANEEREAFIKSANNANYGDITQIPLTQYTVSVSEPLI